jgi:hypothetical protein
MENSVRLNITQVLTSAARELLGREILTEMNENTEPF